MTDHAARAADLHAEADALWASGRAGMARLARALAIATGALEWTAYEPPEMRRRCRRPASRQQALAYIRRGREQLSRRTGAGN